MDPDPPVLYLAPEGRYNNSRIGPQSDNPKLRHFYWLLNRLTAAMANENEVI